MSKLTLPTSSQGHSSQYEYTQHSDSTSSMPCAPTPIRRPRRRPTHLLQLPKQCPKPPRNNNNRHHQLLNPQLHRPQQQHRRYISELLGQLGDERVDVQLELHDQDMRRRGDMVDVFPTARIRERWIRLFDLREFALFGAAAWGPDSRCAGVLWGV